MRRGDTRIGKGSIRHAWAAVAIGVLFWLVVCAILGIALERERRQALAYARQEASSITAAIEENTARTFDGVDLALEGIAAHLATAAVPRDDPALRETLRGWLRHLPPVRALFIIGPDGWIAHDTDYPKTPHVSLADRAYFQQYLRDPSLQHALSPALQSRSGTGWFIASTRRITGPKGEFKGVAVAAIQLNSLASLFGKLDLQPGYTLALLHQDGRLLARFPADDALVGRNYALVPMFSEHLPRKRSDVFETRGPPLGYARIVSYRALDTQPLVVTLAMPMDRVLATWHRTAAGSIAAFLVFTLVTAAGVLFFAQKQEQGRRAAAHEIAGAQAQAAAEANAKFRTFFEQGCFFSCVLSREGTVMEANEAGLQACGMRRDQVVGRKFWECGWWDSLETAGSAMHDAFVALQSEASARVEATLRLEDGSPRLVEVLLSPIREPQGTMLSVAALGHDIHERKLHEQQLRAVADELANADRLKGEFLATLSHELRNVLAPQQNAMNILERVPADSPPGLRARELLKSQLLQMRHLVDDLLDVSRVNSGKIRLQKERVDLRELLADAAGAAHAFMEKPGHSFSSSWTDEPLPVHVDRARLLQVFSNLLSNAAKYTPPGGHVTLRARREAHAAVVEIVDDGMGIPVDAQARIFGMFEQVGAHLARSQGGLGIGLSLVHKLVVLHGGDVKAFSAGPGLGSTFTVHLPLDEPHAQPEAPVVQQGDAGELAT